jgi:FAD/FMN-containing dehydrogenase
LRRRVKWLNPTELRQALSDRFRAEIRFGDHDRALYSTDASIYQVMPLGVIAPADESDSQLVLEESCVKLGVPILPRGGGMSLAAQCTNRAVVLDLSPHLREGGQLSITERTVRAQAGGNHRRDQSLSFLAKLETVFRA